MDFLTDRIVERNSSFNRNHCLKSNDFENQLGEDHMKRAIIMSDVELSYEELKCLEAHFRQMQKDALVLGLKQASADMVDWFGKIIARSRSVEQLHLTESEP